VQDRLDKLRDAGRVVLVEGLLLCPVVQVLVDVALVGASESRLQLAIGEHPCVHEGHGIRADLVQQDTDPVTQKRCLR